MKQILWTIGLVLTCGVLSYSALITKNKTFSTGETIEASDFNDNFDTIYNDYNGNITNANVSASAAIADTKLDLATIAQDIQFDGSTTFVSSPTIRGVDFGISGGSIVVTTGELIIEPDNAIVDINSHVHIGSASVGDLLSLQGSGYVGTIGLDGSRMYIHNNSALRNLTFGVNNSTSNIVIDTSGNVGIGAASGSALFDVDGSFDLGSASDGNQMTIQGGGYVGTIGMDTNGWYFHHNSASRNISFGVNSSTSDLVIESDGQVHVRAEGSADVELEVSNGQGGTTGGGTIHRSASATHSSEKLKEIFGTAGSTEMLNSYTDVRNMPIKEWCYKRKNPAGKLIPDPNCQNPENRRWGPTWETAPAFIRDDEHETIVIDHRVVQLELALQHAIEEIEDLKSRLQAAGIP